MQTRRQYQSGHRFIHATFSVALLYSHLIWSSTCYWSQSKHKSNKLHQSHSVFSWAGMCCLAMD